MTIILDCGHAWQPPVGGMGGAGYGQDSEGKRHCYACCAAKQRADMIATGQATLYLTRAPDINTDAWQVTDWAGALRFPVGKIKHSPKGGGFGCPRIDAWFMGPDGATWHAINRGENQIARCRRVKS